MTSSSPMSVNKLLLVVSTESYPSVPASTILTSTSTLSTKFSAQNTSAASWSSAKSTLQANKVSTLLVSTTAVLASGGSNTSAPHSSSKRVSIQMPLSTFVASTDVSTSSTNAIVTTIMPSTAINYITDVTMTSSDVTDVNELPFGDTSSESATVISPLMDSQTTNVVDTVNVETVNQSSSSNPTMMSPADDITSMLSSTPHWSALLMETTI